MALPLRSGTLRLCLAAVLLLGLVVAGGLFLPIARANVSFRAPAPLGALMRAPPPGWTVADRAVGATEEETSKAEAMLRYDDAFVKVYQKGDTQVMVYVAYWGPARMDPRLIVGHTPDTCWIFNGATMIARDDHRVLPAGGGASLLPGYWRTFDWGGARNQVVFWHLFGGHRSTMVLDEASPDQAKEAPGKVSKFLETMKDSGFGTIRNDQVFVRISTSGTFEELVKSDLWPTLVASLRPTGIAGPR